MKMRVFLIVLIILAGFGVTISVVQANVSKGQEYHTYLEAARRNGENDIPYMAVQNYKSAFAIQNDDEQVYMEYLVQVQALEDGSYESALKQFPELFPGSSTAYEMLCTYYYESGNDTQVIKTALAANSAGAATEQVRDYYLECAYKLKYIKTDLEEASSFLGNYARVKAGGLYGYLNSSGQYAIAPLYENASFFQGSYAGVCMDGEWFMVNEAGYKVARPDSEVDFLSFISGGKILIKKGGRYGYTNTGMKVPQELPYEDATDFRSGVAAVCKDGKWALIDLQEQNITDYEYDDILIDEYNTCICNGVVFAKKNGKYYMLNASGKLLSEQGFDNAYPFSAGEPAAVCIGGKWGFAEADSNIVIEPQYESAKSFHTGLGAVCVDGKWGYISVNNEIRIEPQFDDCLPFSDSGIAAVCQEDSWNYVKLLYYCN